MSIRRLVHIAAGAAMTLALALVGTASAQEVTLKAGSFLPLNINFGEPFKRFADHVNAEGKGLVQIRVVGGPEAVPPFELGNAVKSGVLDMAALPPAYYKGLLPEGDAAILTKMSFVEQRKSGAWAFLNQLHNEKVNAYYLAAYGDGVPFHLYLRKPIKDLSELKGLKLRSSPNYQAFFIALGATTVVTPPGEVYTALERGVIDGYGWPLWGIQDQGWDKYTKMRVDPGFYNVTCNILVNLNKWKSLSEAQRAFLTKMGTWLEDDFPKLAKERNAKEAAYQKKVGVEVKDFGPAFEQQANDLYWAELAKISPDNIAKLKKLLTK
jgi:TRAP-type C4-dicarboxylate transport system substrate-binding protein